MNTATALTLKPGYEWRTTVRTVPVVLPRGSKARSIKEKVFLELHRTDRPEGCLGCVLIQEIKSPWGLVKEISVLVDGVSSASICKTIGINDDHIQTIHDIMKRRPEGSFFEVAA